MHKTMRAEFFNDHQREFATIGQLQASLDLWVAEYNTERPHQSCGGRPPAERFALAERSIVAVEVDEPAVVASSTRNEQPLPAGVTRWVNSRGQISLAGFPYAVGATFSGEPVEVVVTGGLVQVLHRGVLVATHAQRMRPDQADRGPRAPRIPTQRRARDADRDPQSRQQGCRQLRRVGVRVRAALEVRGSDPAQLAEAD